VRTEELPLMFHAQTPDDVWDWYDRRTVRTAAVLNLQKPDVRERIKAAIVAGAQRFVSGGTLTVPNHAVMHAARKPSA
jgi:hypothetical protein